MFAIFGCSDTQISGKQRSKSSVFKFKFLLWNSACAYVGVFFYLDAKMWCAAHFPKILSKERTDFFPVLTRCSGSP